jgi:N6-L-threonylcarbamoyladenine synthase
MTRQHDVVLALETSCDETAAAVVVGGREVRSSVVATQSALHAPFGGVVPELASRAHLDLVNDVMAQALFEAGMALGDLDAVAACRGPGLAGALLVGVAAAKAVSLVAGVPYVGVHHHEAHMYAAMLDDPTLEPPFVTLIVSGGHTLLVEMRAHGEYRVLGQTVDDAAGEAYDKVARLLGLGYPGGPVIDRLAASGDPDEARFTRPMLHDGLDFSFSGLKTAVARYWREHPDAEIADVAAGFQDAVVDVLVTKLLRAAADCALTTIVIGGGVAANSQLRRELAARAAPAGLRAVVPSPALCTDNAAMVGAVGWYQLQRLGPSSLGEGVSPGLRLDEG